MRTIILIISVLFSFYGYSDNNTKSQIKVNYKGERIGYLVCVTGNINVKCKKVQKIKLVDDIYTNYFPNVKIDVEKELKHSNYFQLSTENKSVYVEKKIIKKKKNGKLKYKKYK